MVLLGMVRYRESLTLASDFIDVEWGTRRQKSRRLKSLIVQSPFFLCSDDARRYTILSSAAE